MAIRRTGQPNGSWVDGEYLYALDLNDTFKNVLNIDKFTYYHPGSWFYSADGDPGGATFVAGSIDLVGSVYNGVIIVYYPYSSLHIDTPSSSSGGKAKLSPSVIGSYYSGETTIVSDDSIYLPLAEADFNNPRRRRTSIVLWKPIPDDIKNGSFKIKIEYSVNWSLESGFVGSHFVRLLNYVPCFVIRF